MEQNIQGHGELGNPPQGQASSERPYFQTYYEQGWKAHVKEKNLVIGYTNDPDRPSMSVLVEKVVGVSQEPYTEEEAFYVNNGWIAYLAKYGAQGYRQEDIARIEGLQYSGMAFIMEDAVEAGLFTTPAVFKLLIQAQRNWRADNVQFLRNSYDELSPGDKIRLQKEEEELARYEAMLTLEDEEAAIELCKEKAELNLSIITAYPVHTAKAQFAYSAANWYRMAARLSESEKATVPVPEREASETGERAGHIPSPSDPEKQVKYAALDYWTLYYGIQTGEITDPDALPFYIAKRRDGYIEELIRYATNRDISAAWLEDASREARTEYDDIINGGTIAQARYCVQEAGISFDPAQWFLMAARLAEQEENTQRAV